MDNTRDRRLQREAEKRRLASRQETIEEIHRLYARFGDRVVLVMVQALSENHGLRRLVSRLPIRNAAWKDDQLHDVVVRFINDHGVTRFLEHVQPPQPSAAAPANHRAPAEVAQSPSQEDWVCEDRRSGQERRSGIDRRDRVDLIFKNQRFGRDRRSGIDRRRNQVPPPWPKG